MSSSVSKQSKEGVRLCEHIVRQAFGNAVHRVSSLLLNRGRLGVNDLCRASGLSQRAVAGALIILMQHGLVHTTSFYALDGTESRDGAYEFDEAECLHRLRYGRILAITSQWQTLAPVRDIAVEAVRLIMLHGRLDGNQLRRVLVTDASAFRATQVDDALLLLAQEGFLRPTAPQLQISPQAVLERKIKIKRSFAEGNGDTKKILSRTELAEIEKSAASEIDIERSDLENPTRLLTTRGSGRSGKPDVSLVRDIPVRLNHDRYGILIRDEVICKAVGDRWNQGASITMRATLLASLTEAASLRDSRTPVSVTAGDVIKCLPSAHPAPAGTLMADLVGLSSKSTAEHVRQYLQILAGDDQAGARTEVFLFKPASSSEAKYQVEVERVAKILRQAILLDMVRQQLSNVHARVLSVVMAAQVASEETVRDVALMSYTDARTHLSALQRLCLVEPQEVPKTAAKMRTGLPATAEYHLWTIDLARAYNTLLASFYKSIANAVERMTKVQHDKREMLERVQKARQGHRVHKLQAKDQEDLVVLLEQRRKLTLAAQRVGTLLFVLRDLPGWPGSNL